MKAQELYNKHDYREEAIFEDFNVTQVNIELQG